jgi:hypothetical protein
MIQLPRRSVTRFFIPLIDVLTVLFSLYLLMPMLGADPRVADTTERKDERALNQGERQELAELRGRLREIERLAAESARERQELERIRTEKITTLQKRLAVRVVEIDANTGKLYYYDPERREISGEAAAHALIRRQRKDAGGRELYYLFLFPRELTGYPTERQVRQYDRWFDRVARGIDNPRAPRRGAGDGDAP